jgi:hypothetical protein
MCVGVATYETAQTRQFFHGRTETCRSFSKESLDWTKVTLTHLAGNLYLGHDIE